MNLACTLNGPLLLALEQHESAEHLTRQEHVHFVAGREQDIPTRRADVRALISARLPISQSKAAFDLALDRGRSTKVQRIPALTFH